MDAFREMCQALMEEKTSLRPIYDRVNGLLYIHVGEDVLQVSDRGGMAHLEVMRNGRSASLDMSCDKARTVLSGILRGDAKLNIFFPAEPKISEKTKAAVGKWLGMAAGIIIALFFGICTLALICDAITYGAGSDVPFHFNIAIILLFAIPAAAGACLAHFSRKGRLSLRKVFGVGIGLLLALAGSFMIYAVWATRNEEPVMPVGGAAAMSALLLPFAAAGVYLIVHAIKHDGKKAIGKPVPTMCIVPSEDIIQKIRNAVRENTEREAISFTLDFEAQPSLTDSKVGGVPYWDMKMEYPCDSGKKLMLLAQFNLSELPENSVFPREGLLQFFVAEECMVEYNAWTAVVYHKTIDPSVTEEDVLALGIATSLTVDETAGFPVEGQMGVKYRLIKESMNSCNAGFEQTVAEAAAELGVDTYGCDLDIFDPNYDNEDEDAEAAHRLTGYPSFAQFDPRDSKMLEMYDTLLMQLSSDGKREGSVLWGDWGVANFFINSADLRAMDFDDVYFTWDCY